MDRSLLYSIWLAKVGCPTTIGALEAHSIGITAPRVRHIDYLSSSY